VKPTLESLDQLTCINTFIQMVSHNGSSLWSSLSRANRAHC
jgi:hypothetical protein